MCTTQKHLPSGSIAHSGLGPLTAICKQEIASIVMVTGQSDRENFSVEAPSSWVTQIYIKLSGHPAQCAPSEGWSLTCLKKCHFPTLTYYLIQGFPSSPEYSSWWAFVVGTQNNIVWSKGMRMIPFSTRKYRQHQEEACGVTVMTGSFNLNSTITSIMDWLWKSA